MTSLSATGNIKNYQIVVSSIILCILPAGYMALRLGYDAASVFYISIVFTFISGIARFLYCRKQIGYSLKKMMRNVFLPIAGVIIISLPFPIFMKFLWFTESSLPNFISLCSVSVIFTITISWFIGLKRNERQTLVTVIKNKIHKK